MHHYYYDSFCTNVLLKTRDFVITKSGCLIVLKKLKLACFHNDDKTENESIFMTCDKVNTYFLVYNIRN